MSTDGGEGNAGNGSGDDLGSSGVLVVTSNVISSKVTKNGKVLLVESITHQHQ